MCDEELISQKIMGTGLIVFLKSILSLCVIIFITFIILMIR